MRGASGPSKACISLIVLWMTFSTPLLMRKSIQGGKVRLWSSVETELL
jgi:hypothetical protein